MRALLHHIVVCHTWAASDTHELHVTHVYAHCSPPPSKKSDRETVRQPHRLALRATNNEICCHNNRRLTFWHVSFQILRTLIKRVKQSLRPVHIERLRHRHLDRRHLWSVTSRKDVYIFCRQRDGIGRHRPLKRVHTKSQRHRQRQKRFVEGKMGMRPIPAVTVPIKKIKGSASQRNVVTVGVDEPLKRVHTNSQRYRQREKTLRWRANGYATHSGRHSAHQKDQRCRHQYFLVNPISPWFSPKWKYSLHKQLRRQLQSTITLFISNPIFHRETMQSIDNF